MILSKMYKKFAIVASLLMPALVSAATVSSIIGKVKLWTGTLIPILIGVALAYFIWNTILVIRAEGDKRDEAKKGMWAGIIALFIIVSIWGIVQFIGSSLDVEQGGQIVIPHF